MSILKFRLFCNDIPSGSLMKQKLTSLHFLMRTTAQLLLLGVLLSFVPAEILATSSVAKLTTGQQALSTLSRCDAGLADVVAYVRKRPELFSKDREGLLTLEEKREIRNTWKRFLEYQLALETIAQANEKYYELDGKAEVESFYAGYAASVTQYRHALEFLELTGHNDAIDKLLNEPVPDIGLHEDAFSKFKFRFLNAGRGLEFAAREIVFASYSRKHEPPRREVLRAHASKIWEMGRGQGQKMTLRNAARIVQKAGFSAWLPIQTSVSEWMGDTKVYRPKKSLITPEQIARLSMEPGDIMLQRRDWYLSNVGLPGFWPHAALYIGTVEERRKYFDEPEVRTWVEKQSEPSGDLEKLLQKQYPNSYDWSKRSEEGHRFRVLEAISEGVVFTTLEHSAAADTMVVLRPKRTKKEKAAALFRAFHYIGRPYDFDFDFDTDTSLVCTELVCKAYEPNGDSAGLVFPVETMLGRKVIPANLIVQQFDETFGTARQQVEMVYFLDANERAGSSLLSTVDAFRKSWQRPKWHVFLQGR